MHYYASDSGFRGRIAFFALGVVATLGAYLLSVLLMVLKVVPPWWIEIPSILGVYGVVVAAYDCMFWRVFSNMPNLNGTWIGEIASSFDGEGKTRCVARIRQTWTRLSVELETAQSLSRTTMAAIYQETPGEMGINYEYLSEPKALATSSMQSHRGTSHLRISTAGDGLTGSYYTGRGRGTVGEISLTRVSLKQLDYEAAIKKESA